jgi:hypothetical protein
MDSQDLKSNTAVTFGMRNRRLESFAAQIFIGALCGRVNAHVN